MFARIRVSSGKSGNRAGRRPKDVSNYLRSYPSAFLLAVVGFSDDGGVVSRVECKWWPSIGSSLVVAKHR